MGTRTNKVSIVAAAVATIVLVFTDLDAAGTVYARLFPIFIFVTGMSVVVNIAAQVGVFDFLTDFLERIAPRAERWRRLGLWLGLLLSSIVITVFLSLDTTAILLTPLAISIARRNSLNIYAVALAVVWIANIASLHLPVSNLTNLLALSGGAFKDEVDYISTAWLPATIATSVAVLAALLVNLVPFKEVEKSEAEIHSEKGSTHRILKPALIVLGILLPALASPIPYWISSSVAAFILMGFALRNQSNLLKVSLIPWPSLLLATGMSVTATAVNTLGGAALVQSMLHGANPLEISLSGAVAANLMNNIPAYLALEPAIGSSVESLALLIGVNTGPIITPWASLATLLWHDQLLRAGVHIRWRTFIAFGLVLAPLGVILSVLPLMA